MQFKVNGVDLAVSPAVFRPTVLDLDDADGTGRTADGMSYRDRVAIKRQFEISWNAIKWADLSSILQAMSEEYFNFTYPDPMTGRYETKRFYVGNRTVGISFKGDNGDIWWDGLQMVLTEQ